MAEIEEQKENQRPETLVNPVDAPYIARLEGNRVFNTQVDVVKQKLSFTVSSLAQGTDYDIFHGLGKAHQVIGRMRFLNNSTFTGWFTLQGDKRFLIWNDVGTDSYRKSFYLKHKDQNYFTFYYDATIFDTVGFGETTDTTPNSFELEIFIINFFL